MVSIAPGAVHSNRVSPDLKLSLKRTSLFDLFQQYVPVLSGLPGGTSQFDQTDIGFEWHCEFEIGAGSTGESSLQIHFHLVELESLPQPAAALYLVELGGDESEHCRLALPVENLTDTHEQLNKHLAEKDADIGAYENASNFITALTSVRESLLGQVAWV